LKIYSQNYQKVLGYGLRLEKAELFVFHKEFVSGLQFCDFRPSRKDLTMIDTGDTAWILVSTALVMMMTPALAFFYGGMVRKKNILSTLNLSFIMLAVMSIQWLLFGYTLAFGTTNGGLIGGLEFLGFNNVGAEPNAAYADVRYHHPCAYYRSFC
jgi:hypothetical protein